MSGQLFENMYQSARGREASALFSLRDGQMLENHIVHNGYWYNRAGKLLGHGDLSHQNLADVAAGLDQGEVFVVLSEYNAFGSGLHEAKGPYGHSLRYIADHAMYVIVQGRVYARRVFADSQYRRITAPEIYKLL